MTPDMRAIEEYVWNHPNLLNRQYGVNALFRRMDEPDRVALSSPFFPLEGASITLE
jgi:hypothetical protein